MAISDLVLRDLMQLGGSSAKALTLYEALLAMETAASSIDGEPGRASDQQFSLMAVVK